MSANTIPNGKRTARNANHEMLRLIAIYMIVFIHANMYLGKFCQGAGWSFFNGLVNGVCNTGVSCFILISGYYGVRFDIRKLVKMECMMITLSLLETGLMYIFAPESLGGGSALLEQLVKSVFPFITRKYWFYSCYVCLLLFSGYLDKLIKALDRETFRNLLLLMAGLFSVLPTVFYFELVPDNGKGLVQMIMIYLIGRYIRMYRDVRLPQVKAVSLFLLLWIVNGISHEHPVALGSMSHHLCKDNSITNIVMAVILFYLFKEVRIRKGARMINRIASQVFAVFALNNTVVFLVMNRWKKYAAAPGPGGVLVFLMLAGIVLAVTLGCLLTGWIRELLLGRPDALAADLICRIGSQLLPKILRLKNRAGAE